MSGSYMYDDSDDLQEDLDGTKLSKAHQIFIAI